MHLRVFGWTPAPMEVGQTQEVIVNFPGGSNATQSIAGDATEATFDDPRLTPGVNVSVQVRTVRGADKSQPALSASFQFIPTLVPLPTGTIGHESSP